ncbi:MAG: hypothetical protein U0359_39585 [Byssovorax sp.]
MDAPPPPPRRRLLVAALGAALLAAGYLVWGRAAAFPPETTPQGAYLRVVLSISQGDPRDCFAYLEDEAQHAAYTIRDYRKKAFDRVSQAYPEPERTRLMDAYKVQASAPDGADIWAEMAQRKGWINRLRKDLSGALKVEVTGERATIETARGTRYAFRKRQNGIWGLSIFTAELLAEAERAARDAEVVEKAAADYERGK